MKVAIITNTCYEEIIPLAKHLSGAIDIDLIAILSQSGAGKQLLFEKDDLWEREKCGLILNVNKKKYISDEFNSYIDSKFNLHALFLRSLAYFHPKNFKIIKGFIQFLKKEKYDLIHFNVNTHLILFIKIFLPSVPIVITIHDPSRHLGEESKLSAILDKFIFNLRNATYILHSNYSLALFDNINRNKSKRFMIPFGNHEWLNEFKKEEIQEENNFILFFGRISKYKGIDVLLESFKQVKQEIPEAHLIIAGNGYYWFDYTKYINDDSIEIINRYIPNEEIVRLLLQAHIVVLPYIEATQSGVVSTVFTFCKPIVATRTGGIPEIVRDGETGLLAEPDDSEALTNAIIKIMQSGILYNTIKKNICNIYNEGEFSWKEISSKTALVYLNVAGKEKIN
jgi:glycosyltransferase involved in cell wall biosynthesis